MKKNIKEPHAIFVAYPLQGHIIPFVHLAIKLASKGFTVTFINTHFIHHQISNEGAASTDAENIFSGVKNPDLDIRYITISDGLPLDFDRSLNHDQFMASLLHVFSAHVECAVKKIISEDSSSSVCCLVADTFFVWPLSIARKFGLLYVSFWTEPALVFTLYYHLDLLRKNYHFGWNDNREDTIVYIPGVRAIQPTDMMSYLQDIDTTTVVHQIIYKAFEEAKGADFVLCNSIQELETDTLSALQTKIPFFAIGPIFPNEFTKSSVATSLWSELDCTQWLNTRPNGSVLYVSFGSYAHVSKNDLVEIANGILLSNVSFLWVLRDDIVSSDDPDPLPEGFKEVMGDRGMIIPWCSQKSVLSHQAIGGFLTHCGWNSILESIWCNVPLLCFPLLTDQFTNRKLVVDDWKVGINLSDRKLTTSAQVAEKINHLMSGESGYELRKAVKGVKTSLEKALTPIGSSEKNFERFIEDLKGRIQDTC